MKFRRNSARLRAAAFAVMLRQQAAERRADENDVWRRRVQRQRSERQEMLRRHDSVRGKLIESKLLSSCFKEFDTDGKGYLTEADLQRVLASFGRQVSSDQELHGMLEAATGYDREQRRVTYGNFVRMMSHAIKSSYGEGAEVFRQGSPVHCFYVLLSGELDAVCEAPDGTEQVLGHVHAGEFFGEASLLAGRQKRSVTMRCATPVEVIKLAKSDFYAGFLGGYEPSTPNSSSSKAPSRRLSILGHASSQQPMQQGIAENRLRETLLGFITMVSTTERTTLRQGEAVFEEGAPVDRFYILTKGELAVTAAIGERAADERSPSERAATAIARGDGQRCYARDGQLLGRIATGEGFGEMSLLARKQRRTKTVWCAAPECEVLSVLGKDFLRIVDKSDVVRESFERLSRTRSKLNEAQQRVASRA